jgi:serine/threonine protein kinase
MVSGNMPAFSYYQNTVQSLSAATLTKIVFTALDFDTTSGMYSSSRFTPTVAGYYQINAAITASTAYTTGQCAIYRNGVQYKIVEYLGQGTFGQVVKCINLKTNTEHAVKIIKNK